MTFLFVLLSLDLRNPFGTQDKFRENLRYTKRDTVELSILVVLDSYSTYRILQVGDERKGRELNVLYGHFDSSTEFVEILAANAIAQVVMFYSGRWLFKKFRISYRLATVQKSFRLATTSWNFLQFSYRW